MDHNDPKRSEIVVMAVSVAVALVLQSIILRLHLSPLKTENFSSQCRSTLFSGCKMMLGIYQSTPAIYYCPLGPATSVTGAADDEMAFAFFGEVFSFFEL